jgi:hypothetical protein
MALSLLHQKPENGNNTIKGQSNDEDDMAIIPPQNDLSLP